MGIRATTAAPLCALGPTSMATEANLGRRSSAWLQGQHDNDCYHVVPAGVLYQRLCPGAASAEL